MSCTLYLESPQLESSGQVAFSYPFHAVESITNHKANQLGLQCIDHIVHIIAQRGFAPPFLWPFMGLTYASMEKQVKDLQGILRQIIQEKKALQRTDKWDMDVLDRLLAQNGETGQDVISYLCRSLISNRCLRKRKSYMKCLDSTLQAMKPQVPFVYINYCDSGISQYRHLGPL